jgi:hypothetical protein
MDGTPRASLRHTLLRLLEALLAPRAAAQDERAASAARANAAAFVDVGGVELAVDMLACGCDRHSICVKPCEPSASSAAAARCLVVVGAVWDSHCAGVLAVFHSCALERGDEACACPITWRQPMQA